MQFAKRIIMDFSKRKLSFILMIAGGGAFAAVIIISVIYNLPTINNVLAVIGLSLLMPAFVGLFMYGSGIKEFYYRRGTIMQAISILCIVAFIITSIFTITR